MFLELKNNFLSVGKRRIDTLIDQARVNIFSVETDGLFFDYSKTNIDLETRSKLLELVINTDVISKRDAMFSGQKIN
jgi:glucose-6-phosphate isomerase